jgi:hypothetical protein
MDEQSLQGDITVAEELDQQLQSESTQIEDIRGSMEAVTNAIVADEEPTELTEHQRKRVEDFLALQKASKNPVYTVADKGAVAAEAYVDLRGNLVQGDAQSPYPTCPVVDKDGNIDDVHGFFAEHGPNVWGTFKYNGVVVPGNEGFMELTSGLAKKAALAFGNTIPEHFKTTAKGLHHYSELAQRLRKRLIQLKPLLEKRDFPYTNVFEYGAYSRFFQVGGKSLDGFIGFQEAMVVQHGALMHTVGASNSYAIPVMQKMLENLQSLNAQSKPDADSIIALRDSVENYWTYTWKQADITHKPGQPPQVAANTFPERKFTSLAPLLDNRYLLAHEPKSNGGTNPEKIAANIKHYGAAVVFDKKAGPVAYNSMVIPNIEDLLELVIQTIAGLNEIKGLEHLAKMNEGFAKDFKKATDVLSKAVQDSKDKEFFGFIAEYFRLATSVSTTIQQPYVQMAWLYVRCAMVVVSLAELAVLEEPKERVVYARFGAKQSTEFGNPAMESYNLTQKVLEGAWER